MTPAEFKAYCDTENGPVRQQVHELLDAIIIVDALSILRYRFSTRAEMAAAPDAQKKAIREAYIGNYEGLGQTLVELAKEPDEVVLAKIHAQFQALLAEHLAQEAA